MRTLACAALALLLGTGIALADKGDKAGKGGKKGRFHGAFGTIKKIDGNNLTVTVKNRKSGDETDKTFKLTDDTKIIVHKGKEKTEYTLKEGLSQLKQGSKVMVRLSEDGKKVLAVGTGEFKFGGKRGGGKKPKADK